MVEVAIVVGAFKPPRPVMGYLCEFCPGRAVLYPESSYLDHMEAHETKPEGGRICIKCGKDLPWDRFPRTERYIARRCFGCRPKEAMNRGRPKGIRFKKTGIQSHRVWGPRHEEDGDG